MIDIEKYQGEMTDLGDLDIFIVTFNPEQTLFRSVLSALGSQVTHSFSKTHLHIWDNATDHETQETTRKLLETSDACVDSMHYHTEGINLGFGQGNNQLMSLSHSPWILLLNQDAVPESDALQILSDHVRHAALNDAAWELRQIPYEHPKIYDPSSLDTPWFSGAACLLRRDALVAVGGFDPAIFMYAEDVDLSWRLRAAGWSLKYIPRAAVFHDTYSRPGEEKPLQAIEGTLTNLKLRARFGTQIDILIGLLGVGREILRPASFPGRRRAFIELIPRFLSSFQSFRNSGKDYRRSFRPRFIGWDYSLRRDGPFFSFRRRQQWSELPLVSIIVRTHRRPSMLREALQSLIHQTYPALEIIVIEDGEDTARKMIEQEFGNHPKLIYQSTGKPVGRSRAGNIGLAQAGGEWLGFLDDDDQLFADHVEVLLQAALEAGVKCTYAGSWEVTTKITSLEPLRYQEVAHESRYRQPFSRPLLWHHNYIPIQSALFHRSLYEAHGGFIEDMEQLEDWNLWTRYSLKDDFLYVNKTTSKYRIPYCPQHSAERQKKLDDAYTTALARQKMLSITLSPREFMEMAEEYVRASAVVVVSRRDARTWLQHLGITGAARRTFRYMRRAYRLAKGQAH